MQDFGVQGVGKFSQSRRLQILFHPEPPKKRKKERKKSLKPHYHFDTKGDTETNRLRRVDICDEIG